MAAVRAERQFPSCVESDYANGVDIQTRQMIEWAMTGFLPSGPQALDPSEGKHAKLNTHPCPCMVCVFAIEQFRECWSILSEEQNPYEEVCPEMWFEPEAAYTPPPAKKSRKNAAETAKIKEVTDEVTRGNAL